MERGSGSDYSISHTISVILNEAISFPTVLWFEEMLASLDGFMAEQLAFSVYVWLAGNLSE